MQPISFQEINQEKKQDGTIKNIIQRCYFGQILTKGEQAIEQCCIKLVDQQYNPIAHTYSDHNGHFLLVTEGLANYQIIVSKPGYQTHIVNPILPHTFLKVAIVEQTSPYCIIMGNVLAEKNLSANHIAICLKNAEWQQFTFPDIKGDFIFTQVPPGKYSITVQGAIYETQNKHITVSNCDKILSLSPFYIVPKNIGCTLHGFIHDENNLPIDHALVLLYHATGKQYLEATYTNEQGIYFFAGLDVGDYLIKAFYDK